MGARDVECAFEWMSEGSDEPGGNERVVGVGAALARDTFDDAAGEDGAVAGVSSSL